MGQPRGGPGPRAAAAADPVARGPGGGRDRGGLVFVLRRARPRRPRPVRLVGLPLDCVGGGGGLLRLLLHQVRVTAAAAPLTASVMLLCLLSSGLL